MFIRLSFVTLVFALAALGTPLVKRDATGTLQSIQKLDEWTNILTRDLDGLTTSDNSGIKNIEIAVANMDAWIKAATDNTINSEDFTADQANDILDFAKKQLESDVEKALTVLESKKNTFTKLDEGSVAEFGLQTLRVDTIKFADALKLKVPKKLWIKFEALLSNILNLLSDAINEYSD